MVKAYKDTKVELRPYSRDTVVNVSSPSTYPTAQDTGARRRVRLSASTITTHDEPLPVKDDDEFRKRYIATQGSVYFRKRKVYPRSFLWRVVNDSKVLEVQCVDLSKNGTEQIEYDVTLRLDFQEEVLPSAVAFADTENHDTLSIFVITISKQLHTLTLRPAWFQKMRAIDKNVLDWWKSCTPAPLSFSYPHRLHASSPLELFVSLDNGSILRLNRRSGDDGSFWSPLTLDERTWGSSIRGLVRWNTASSIKHRGLNLDRNTANAIVTTSDQTYILAVCLNHTLKVWNLATNKLVATTDLLARDRSEDESMSYSLSPSETSFIRVFNAERALDGQYRYYIVTYSPHENGCFKFWAAKGGLTSQLIIEDLFPDNVLRPPDPDATGNMFWTVIDFDIKPMEQGKRMELWVLWGNNNVYQLHSLHFDFQNLAADWSHNWISTAIETRQREPPPLLVSSDAVDPTEKWLKYLFEPGRFLLEVLETALAVYQEALKPFSFHAAQKRDIPFSERLCSVVTAAVTLRKYSEGSMAFERYRMDTDAKWRQYWQIADDINSRRFEPISLAYDTYYEIPWLVLSDNCAVIRECSATELLLHNSSSELRAGISTVKDRWAYRDLSSETGDSFEQASYLVQAASAFRGRFSAEFDAACRDALEAEIFGDPSSSIPDRMDAFRERCELEGQASNVTYSSLLSAISEHLDVYALSADPFYAIVDTVPLGFPGKDSDLLATKFGIRLTVGGVQESILQTRQILTELLLLVIFLDGVVEQEKESTFDAADLFGALISLLKEYEMMAWLGSNARMCRDSLSSDSDSVPSPLFSRETGRQDNLGRMATILEDLFATDIKPRQTAGLPQTYTLMLGIRDVLSWVTRQGEVAYPNALAYIQCDLIAKGNIDLAWDFLRFQPSTSWATYVKGRLYVAMSDFDTAAIYFRKAAYLLSCGKPLGNLHEMSSALLDIVSLDCFHSGLPKYYQHVLSVFEQVRSFSYVADFASLALQSLETEGGKEHGPEYTNLQTDILSRLFHASLKTCQFDQAYSALSRYSDIALQKSALSSLVTSILSELGSGTAGLEQVLRLPTSLFSSISSYVDEILLSLSRKQDSFNSLLDMSKNVADDTPDYRRILQAYRVARSDYRGAAEVAYENVQRLRHARDSPSSHLHISKSKQTGYQVPVTAEDDPESKEIRHELLSLINLLACVDKSDAYILVEREDCPSISALLPMEKHRSLPSDDDGNVFMDDPYSGNPQGHHRRSSGGIPKPYSRRDSKSSLTEGEPADRIIVTLDYLRREYQAELDRVSRIERGDWGFGMIEDQDEDGADYSDETMVLS